MDVDPKALDLVRTVADAVKDLPEAVQPRAFEFLLQSRLAHAKLPIDTGKTHPEVEGHEGHWVEALARDAGISTEQVLRVFAHDEDGPHVVSTELGQTVAERTKNVAVLLLWAERTLKKTINYPTSRVRNVLEPLGVDLHNFDRHITRDPCLKVMKVKGSKCLQLSGKWRERVKELFESYAT